MTETTQQTFADFDVDARIVEALASKGIEHPFPIQAMTLPVALGGHDIIGQAQTGTGKTLGFGIPALQRVVAPGEDGYEDLPHPGAPQALIVAPTRELAVQVADDLTLAASKRSVRIATIYGGRAYEPQIEQLAKGVDVVVGTPGRLIDLNRQRHLNLSAVRIVVLDEADEMLDLGFLPDVERLIAAVPEVRQTMLFSATMPGPVISMARRYMSKPTHIRASAPDESANITKKDIRQLVYRAHQLDKDEVVARVLQAEGRGRTIIFTRTKRQADRMAEELKDRGFAAGALHGDLGQGAREQALRAFRNNKVDVLVATDVAARGIDVEDVTHVINLYCPDDEKTYLHRVGRTGRAGHKGTAVTFVDWEDVPRWGLINKALGLDFEEPRETYSSSEHLFEDLNIPKGTKGRLPRDKRVLAGLDAEHVEDLGGPDSRKSRGGRSGSGRSGSRRSARSGRGRGERGRSERGERSGRGEGGRSGRSGGRQRRRTRSGEGAESTRQNSAQGSAQGKNSAQPKNPTQRSDAGAQGDSGSQRSRGGSRSRRRSGGRQRRRTRSGEGAE